MYLKKITTWFHNVHLSDYYYLLVTFGYILTLFVTQMRPGLFATLLMFLVILELVLKRELAIKSILDWLVVSYVVYNLLSIIWLSKNGYPASVYVQEFSNSILPIVFYFVGTSAGIRTKDFYKKYKQLFDQKVSIPKAETEINRIMERLDIKPPLSINKTSVWRIDNTDGFKFILKGECFSIKSSLGPRD